MTDPIPFRPRPARPARAETANAAPARGLGSARPPAYRREPVPPLRWHVRWPRPHPIAWALFGCVVFWWAVICAVRF
jgi:hypothetical protein